jgi:hypothetical protein
MFGPFLNVRSCDTLSFLAVPNFAIFPLVRTWVRKWSLPTVKGFERIILVHAISLFIVTEKK